MSEVRNDQVPDGVASDAVAEIQAASVIVLRGEPLEVLLMRRNDEGTFVPGAWIFPGGALDQADCEVAGEHCEEGNPGQDSMKVCGMRETLEEAGVWLGADAVDPQQLRARLREGHYPIERAHVAASFDRLVLTSRWVTPEGLPRRYDTWFFLAEAPADCQPEVDGSEGVELRWIRPGDALARNERGEMKLLFPTIRNLLGLVSCPDAASALADRRGAHIIVQRPVLVREAGRTRITLPGEE